MKYMKINFENAILSITYGLSKLFKGVNLFPKKKIGHIKNRCIRNVVIKYVY